MITAQQKIGEKVYSHLQRRPTKFPPPDGSIRLILTDMRGYLDEGGDHLDYHEIAYGWRSLPQSSREFLTHFWPNREGKMEPVKGLFESDNPLTSARFIQERIHFLGFIRERNFEEGEIRDWSLLLGNPNMFSSADEQKAAYWTYPLAVEGKMANEARRRRRE